MNTSKKACVLLVLICYGTMLPASGWNWLSDKQLGKQCRSIASKAYNHPYLIAAASIATIVVTLKVLNFAKSNIQSLSIRSMYDQFITSIKAYIDKQFIALINNYMSNLKKYNTDVLEPTTYFHLHMENLNVQANFLPAFRLIEYNLVCVDTQANHGVTALYLAVKGLNPKLVNTLVNLGANPNAPITLNNNTITTPMEAAQNIDTKDSGLKREIKANILAYFGDNSLREELNLDQKIYTDALREIWEGKYNNRPIGRPILTMMQLIQTKRIDPNFQVHIYPSMPTFPEQTALHIITQINDKDLKNKLIDDLKKLGADPLIKDSYGKNMYDYLTRSKSN